MKAVLEKAINVIGGYARGNQQRRLDPVEGTTAGDEHLIPFPVMVPYQDIPTPALSTLIMHSGGATSEGDDVLFRKNNVLLKHQGDMFNQASKIDVLHSSGVESSDKALNGGLGGNSLDNHVLIPGFLFVTTRGSNFGTTLILNWAPNSSMTVPQHTCEPENDPPAATGALRTAQNCSSISIDLCSMEMIRIFYHMDDSGFIISGELVVKSKEENFKVHISKGIPPISDRVSGIDSRLFLWVLPVKE